MASINQVFLLGNLTRDPELSYTPQGTALCKFGMAMNEKWKDAQGNQKEKVCFVDITCWKRTGEIAAQYLKKGDPVHVQGSLVLEQWEDKNTQQKRSKITVNGQKITLLGGKKDGAQGGGQEAPADQGVGDDQVPF